MAARQEAEVTALAPSSRETCQADEAAPIYQNRGCVWMLCCDSGFVDRPMPPCSISSPLLQKRSMTISLPGGCVPPRHPIIVECRTLISISSRRRLSPALPIGHAPPPHRWRLRLLPSTSPLNDCHQSVSVSRTRRDDLGGGS